MCPGPPDPPTGLRANVEGQSVRLSWNTVPGADSYSVSYTRATGSEQLGLCPDYTHSGSVPSVNDNMVQIDMDNDETLLQAYSTYSYTVRAVNNIRGNSDPSSEDTFTTPQRGTCSEIMVFGVCPGENWSVVCPGEE